MITSAQVEAEFRADLNALLKKYSVDSYEADITIDNHFRGNAGCGEDIRAEVSIPSIYDETGNTVREWTTINLGQYVRYRSEEDKANDL